MFSDEIKELPQIAAIVEPILCKAQARRDSVRVAVDPAQLAWAQRQIAKYDLDGDGRLPVAERGRDPAGASD